MKKIVFIFCMVILTITAGAQETHLKFMGVELNGTIDQFQSALSVKGVRLSKDNAHAPAGMRTFEGVFSGEKADIIVFYNVRTKEVYRAKAIISKYGEDNVKQALSNMEAKLDQKYGTENKFSDDIKDDHLHEFTQHSYFVGNGSIGLFIISTSYSSQSTFNLHVDYSDSVNASKNNQQEMDDL